MPAITRSQTKTLTGSNLELSNFFLHRQVPLWNPHVPQRYHRVPFYHLFYLLFLKLIIMFLPTAIDHQYHQYRWNWVFIIP